MANKAANKQKTAIWVAKKQNEEKWEKAKKVTWKMAKKQKNNNQNGK